MFSRGIALAAAAASMLAGSALALRRDEQPHMDFGPLFIGGGGRPATKGGKRKPRRHGRKLKANRLHISKRVRRKHRRAA